MLQGLHDDGGSGYNVVMEVEQQFSSKRQLVAALKERDGDHCYLCGKPFNKHNQPTLDHIHPLSKGGTWDFDNLGLAHRRCNLDKGDRLLMPDGSLEPRARRVTYRERKANRREALENLCEVCMDGRLLLKGEICEDCGSPPGPPEAPYYLRVAPKNCDHHHNFCWMCYIGIIERKSSLQQLIIGDSMEE